MSPIEIEEFNSEELAQTLHAFTDILRDVGVLQEGTKVPDHLMDYHWVSDEPDDPDWPRDLVKAISSHWPTVTEAQAAAVLLGRLTELRAHSLGAALAASAEDDIGATIFARTMDKVAPEFSQALEKKQAGEADVALRMMLSKVFNIDPTSPSDTFFVDATVYAYDEIFGGSANSIITQIVKNMSGMPDNAIGYAMVLSGSNGLQEIWLEKPGKRATRSLLMLAADAIDAQDVDLEKIKKNRDAIAAGAILLCASALPPTVLARMLGAAAQILGVQGMLITADPRAGCKHEILQSGSFNAIHTTDLIGLRHSLMGLPSVERFRELMDLLEETTDSFNDRLMRLASQAQDDMQ